MANAVGKVSVLHGQAFVRGADGSQRALKVGDLVMEGEVIVTAPGGHVELALNGGQAFQIREQETVTLDKSVLGVDLPEIHAAALLDRLPDTAAITQAIALGSPLDVLLEETAAGLDGGSEGGHSFVQLLRVVEGTSANAPFSSAGGFGHVLPAVEGGAGLREIPVQTVPRDTTPPNAPTVELTHDTGASGSDHITNNGALTVTGTEAGAFVEYSTDGTTWTNSYTPVEGTNTVYVRQTDVAGNVSGSTSLSFTLDTQGPLLSNQSFSYPENQSTGTVIGHATATDSSGVAGYQFKWTDGSLHSVSEDGYFGIGTDGRLTMTSAGAGSAANDFEALANSRDFTVVATDVAGNQSQAVLTFSETNRNDSAPAIGDATVSVSEKGLAGGMLDLVNPANNLASANGTLAVSDADGSLNPLSVSLVAPTATLTSHGQVVVWSGSGTGTLVGSAGGVEVIRISVDNGGAYSVKLEAPISHSVAGALDAKTINVGTQVSDGLHVTSGNLAINVLDDAPAVGNLTESIVLPKIDTNVMIVLDVSGSMGNASGIAGQNRLDAAKSAIKGLIDKYDSLGDVSVRVVYFDTNAHEVGTGWVDATTGKTQVTNLSLGSSTNYDAALAQAISAFGEPGKIAGAQNVCYFLSDGQPNYANGSTSTLTGTLNTSKFDIGIQGAEETSWTNFLQSNGIQTYAIGMGTGLPANATTYLDPVAYDGGGAGTNTNSMIVTNMAQLSAVLESTVPAPATGNLLTGNTLYGSGIGADGGYIPSMTLDGRTYNYDVSTHNISISGTSSDSYSYNATTHSLSVNTAQGGVLVVNFDSGDYSYTPSATVAGTVSENLGLSLTDADGDTASGTLTLNISRQGTSITGTAVADTLTGSTGADAIAGGAGSDTLSGLAGADTFKWSLGDQGTPSTPAIDTVTDFDGAINGDKLDLRDLLQGEHATGANANLQNYLHFEKSGSDTIVHVSSTGGFGADSHSVGPSYSSGAEDQRIVLQGANLVGTFATDQQVIQDLLNKGKLQTD